MGAICLRAKIAVREDCAMAASKKSAAKKKATKRTIAGKKKIAATKNDGSDEIVALYEKLVATIPSLERKGDANPYTSMNGNMFTLLHQSRTLAIRLPEDKRDEFLKKYKTKSFEAYGAVMKEYVTVPEGLLPKTKELEEYFKASFDYAKTLKPKPTRKTA